MSHGLVNLLEAEYLPALDALAADLRASFPRFTFQTGSSATGSITTYQGHDLFLERLFPDRPADRSDNLALEISVCHLDRSPLIMAGICWGHPSGQVEDALDANWTSSDHWPEATESTLERLRGAFPRLCEEFRAAVTRGEPPPVQA
jgi:hypothetical protein